MSVSESPLVDAPDASTTAPEPSGRRASSSRVLAVLVAHDGGPYLSRTLAALAAQTHEHLEVLAVDNGSNDDTRVTLQAALGDEQVLVAERDLGFGAAVSMALDARAADDAPYVLLVHDDLALAPEAIAELAAALDADPRLAIVGPKLLDWDDPRLLQSVGWTVDLTGRADSGVDEHELDQGQRDVDRRTLYVSTSGMMLRREVFDRLGRFDRRFHLFRDDLDLCWRTWLAGHDVEVIPDAVGEHAAAATNYHRLGQTRVIGPRYFAERNTLATLLKNYGPLRLLTIVPLYFLVGVAKILGFVLTRRFSDAWLTIRAWLWNVLHVFETRRLRRQVQADRRRTDGEVKEMFGRIAPRMRAYSEAIAEWVAGGDVVTGTDERPVTPVAPETATARMVRLLRERPVLVAGALLTIVVVAGAIPLLATGTLRGGELAPWPASPRAFLADHAAAWHTAAGLGTDVPASPSQAVLGLLQGLLFGSAYLASRAVLLGSLLVAWITALRAAQRYSDRKLPRVAAATAYVLSPPTLAALLTGQVSALVVIAVLPGLVAAGGTLARRSSPPGRAWRATAASALLGGIAVAFAPVMVVVLLIAAVGLLVVVLPGAPRDWRGPLTARVGLATLGPIALLLPWSWSLFAADGPIRGVAPEPVVSSELWRWVLLVPDIEGFPGVVAGLGFLLAGILGVLFGWRRQARLVAVLWLVGLSSSVVGWWLGRVGSPVWPGLPLILAAAAYAGLLAVAFARGETSLGRHAFGWRQVAAATTGVAVVVSLGAVALDLVRGPEGAYVRDLDSLPAFVTATATPSDPFLVLLLADVEGVVTYEVVPGAGPTMAATGLTPDPQASAVVDAAVADLVAGRDIGATATLGRLGVRYVIVPDGGISDDLDAALRSQVGLEPRPVATGRVLAVTDALPRASVVPADAADALAATGALPRETEPVALRVLPDGRAVGGSDEAGVLVLSELPGDRFVATADGVRLAPVDGPVAAFQLTEPSGRIEVAPVGQGARTVALTGQLLIALLVLSLMLRPPGFARGGGPAESDPHSGDERDAGGGS
ncbi:glycosyltransferase family 2 protein [Nitriliruptor alkaliphilus]|uniref:glycosyltransferase family 2 protein n=1 Tax=Nitriliruptor alkaliphilus TaxID=427918 RepID=UPI000A9E4E7B|nr:glycosyltransferase family 2 protein [Nitriliruptor alkaliphilus]